MNRSAIAAMDDQGIAWVAHYKNSYQALCGAPDNKKTL